MTIALHMQQPEYRLVQRIDLPIYQNSHLLDDSITRLGSDSASNFVVADIIVSDHVDLHASLT